MKKFLLAVLKFIGLFLLSFIVGLFYLTVFTGFPDYSFMWWCSVVITMCSIGSAVCLGIAAIFSFFVNLIKKIFRKSSSAPADEDK